MKYCSSEINNDKMILAFQKWAIQKKVRDMQHNNIVTA